MIELTLLTILFTIVVIVLKPGRTPPLENPLVIERIGQFRATLAPRLNLSQPLLEHISRNLTGQARSLGDTSTFYFSVRDADVKAHGTDHYLLAATLHDGMLYFEVCSPRPLTYDYNTIQNAASTAHAGLQLNREAVTADAESGLLGTIHASADHFNVKIARLTSPG